MDGAGIPRATIRKIIGHETDAMFDQYRIVDQHDIQEARRLAQNYRVKRTLSASVSLKSQRKATLFKSPPVAKLLQGNSVSLPKIIPHLKARFF